ncbi:MAG: iron ABC transporter permease, partial [bacterium]
TCRCTPVARRSSRKGRGAAARSGSVRERETTMEPRKDLFTPAALAVSAVFFALFLFYPLGYAAANAVAVEGRVTADFFRLLASNPVMAESILNSFLIGACVTLLSLVLGYVFAWFMARFAFSGKALWGTLLMAPMVLPPFVGAIGVRQVFGRYGMVNSLLINAGLIDPRAPVAWLSEPFWGVVILETLHLFPIVYLNISGSFALTDPSLEEAARGLGARGVRLFRSITFPLLLPGVFAGCAIVFIWAFTDLGTPLIFEYRTVVPVQIFNMVTQQAENPAGYALVMVVLAATFLLFVAGRLLYGGKRYESAGAGRAGVSPRRLSPPARLAVHAAFALVLALALLPHFSVIMVSLSRGWFLSVLPERFTLDHFRGVFIHPLSFLSVRNSVFLSFMSAGLDVALGGTIAFLLARKRFPGKEVLDALTMLPLAIPGVVLAFGYVGCFSGTALDPRADPFPLLVMSYAVRRLPLVVRAVYAGLIQVDLSLEEAAAGLGAPPRAVLRTVTAPLVLTNVVGGGVLAFAFAMLEVSDSLILAMEERFYPVTKAIYVMLGRLTDGHNIASAMGVMGMALLIAALALSGKLLGKRMGEMFRT